MDVSEAGEAAVGVTRVSSKSVYCPVFFFESPTMVVNCMRDTREKTLIPLAYRRVDFPPELYMHQSADQILVVIVLMFVTSMLIIKHYVIY